jgi:hypothetical protein
MIRSLIVGLVCLSFAGAIASAADEPFRPVPMIKAVQPDTARAGDELTAIGTHLDKALVAELYMIQGDKTIQVKIVDQKEDAIKFAVPASVTPGRYQLMVLTAGNRPQYLEEPVYFTVE